MPNQQGIIIGGFVGAGVLIYAALSDSTIWEVLTGGTNPLDLSGQDGVTSGDASSGSVGSGDAFAGTALRSAVVSAAQSGLSIKSGYREVRPMPASLAAAANTPTDCSGFATLCYKEAHAPDPNGLGYNGYGYTGSLEAHGKKVGTATPGDLHFWHNPDHVAIDVGNGQIIGWGDAPGPTQLSIEEESSYHESYLGARSYLPTKTASAPTGRVQGAGGSRETENN